MFPNSRAEERPLTDGGSGSSRVVKILCKFSKKVLDKLPSVCYHKSVVNEGNTSAATLCTL